MGDQSRQLRASIREFLGQRFKQCPVAEKDFQLATTVALRQYLGGLTMEQALDIGEEIIGAIIDQQESI